MTANFTPAGFRIRPGAVSIGPWLSGLAVVDPEINLTPPHIAPVPAAHRGRRGGSLLFGRPSPPLSTRAAHPLSHPGHAPPRRRVAISTPLPLHLVISTNTDVSLCRHYPPCRPTLPSFSLSLHLRVSDTTVVDQAVDPPSARRAAGVDGRGAVWPQLNRCPQWQPQQITRHISVHTNRDFYAVSHSLV